MEQTKETWGDRFDKEFTFKGDWGERRFSLIRLQNYTQKSPIIQDEKVVEDLETFIEKEISSAVQKDREWMSEKIEETLNSHYSPINGKGDLKKKLLSALIEKDLSDSE